MAATDIKQSGIVYTDEHGKHHFVPGESKPAKNLPGEVSEAELSPELRRRMEELRELLRRRSG
jgi:hypothetical protein